MWATNFFTDGAYMYCFSNRKNSKFYLKSNYFTAEGITDEYYKIYQRAYHIEVFELEESGRSFRFVKEFPPLKSSDNKSLATNDSGYKSDFNSYAARSMMTTNG